VTRLHYIPAAIAFFIALGTSLGAMPLASYLGRRYGLVVTPRHFGRGRPSISYLGGAALATAVLLAFMASAGVPSETQWILGGGIILLILGSADDRRGVSPFLRIFVEAIVAFWLWWTGLQPEIVGQVWLDGLLTVLFLVASVNALNLLDNMDGVAGATGAAAAIGLFGLASLGGQYVLALLAAAVSGASFGFLRYNLGGARIFLGNGGSLFLGFVIGAIALDLNLPMAAPWGFIAAIAILVVPAMDTSIVVLSRLRAGRSPFEGGVDHLSHRLVILGLSTRAAALLHATGSALGAGAAFLAVLYAREEPIIGIIGAFATASILLLRMNVYEPITERQPSYSELRALAEDTPSDGSSELVNRTPQEGTT
jgi:UDP-GlcNAc:undecaprenyl-phosphate/decaprenyl-phosphate GlcNAc-1-phosphate transferase